MFEIVDDMRSGTCPMQTFDVRLEGNELQRLQDMADQLELSIDEVIACIVSKDIITYPDGTFEVVDK